MGAKKNDSLIKKCIFLRNMLQQSKIQLYVFYGLIAFIIISSFLLYSPMAYPFVNSDDALNILIADRYQLPSDVYCWGQDRGGTLIPLVAQFFIRVLGNEPIVAVSFASYLILTLGFIGFSSVLKRKSTVVLFALLWFLPFQRYVNLVHFPIGMGYSMVGFSLLFIRYFSFYKNQTWKKHLTTALSVIVVIFIWGLALWVSDLIAISLIILGTSYFIHALVFKRKEINFIIPFIYSITAIVLFSFFLVYLKRHATYVYGNFKQFSTLTEIGDGLCKTASASFKFLSFQHEPFLISLSAWILLIGLGYGLLYFLQHFKTLISCKFPFFSFALADMFLMLAVIFVSKWVYANGQGTWYFVAPYISFCLYILQILDKAEWIKKRANFVILFSLTLLVSFSEIHYIYQNNHHGFTSKRTQIEKFQRLGQVGILGSYWNSYILSIAHPKTVIASPREHEFVRNFSLIEEIFKQPNIYYVKKDLFKQFPDTIMEFEIPLVRTGKEFTLSGYTLCKYRIGSKNKFYSISNLNCDTHLIDPKTNQIIVDEPKDQYHFLCTGPLTSLLKGKYKLVYHIEFEDLKTDRLPMIMDVSSDYGSKPIAAEFCTSEHYNKENNTISIEFEVGEFKRFVEFRLIYLGGQKVSFSGIDLFQL